MEEPSSERCNREFVRQVSPGKQKKMFCYFCEREFGNKSTMLRSISRGKEKKCFVKDNIRQLSRLSMTNTSPFDTKSRKSIKSSIKSPSVLRSISPNQPPSLNRTAKLSLHVKKSSSKLPRLKKLPELDMLSSVSFSQTSGKAVGSATAATVASSIARAPLSMNKDLLIDSRVQKQWPKKLGMTKLKQQFAKKKLSKTPGRQTIYSKTASVLEQKLKQQMQLDFRSLCKQQLLAGGPGILEETRESIDSQVIQYRNSSNLSDIQFDIIPKQSYTLEVTKQRKAQTSLKHKALSRPVSNSRKKKGLPFGQSLSLQVSQHLSDFK